MMKYKRFLSACLSIVMGLSSINIAFAENINLENLNLDACESDSISLISDEISSPSSVDIEYNNISDIANLKLGNSSINIFNGGVIADVDNDVYYSDSKGISILSNFSNKLISNDKGNNLNVLNNKVWYTYDNKIVSISLTDNEKRIINQQAEMLFVDDNENLYFLHNNDIYFNDIIVVGNIGEIDKFYPLAKGFLISINNNSNKELLYFRNNEKNKFAITLVNGI